MEVIVGGKTYALAGLRLVDIRDLGRDGTSRRMERWAELQHWERLDVTATLVATSARRAGASVTAEQLLEEATVADQEAMIKVIQWILVESKLVPGDQESNPNAQGPGTAS